VPKWCRWSDRDRQRASARRYGQETVDAVVFSLFKKDSKGAQPAAKPGSRAAPKPVARPLPGPVNRNPSSTTTRSAQGPATTNTLPDKDLHRTLALETAAKIDAIESEMARDFLRPGGATTMFGNSAANSTLQRPSQQPDAARPDEKDDKIEALDITSEDWEGNTNALFVQNEGGGSAIEETAILFANGLIEPAEAGLRAAIQGDQLGDSAQHGWLMLFELLQQRGDKAGFDSLTIEYVLRFESSPPAWIDYKDEPSPATLGGLGAASGTPGTAPVIVLPESIDEGVVKQLEQLKNYSLSHQSITIDSSNVRSIDAVGAELLLRVINAFKRASHELLLQGADQLVTPLRAAVEAGRRDPSDAVWMLLLEVFRLLNRQHDFEETGIQYCITYEVSPPSWEPPPPNLKTRAAVPQVKKAPEVVDGLSWHGTLRGEGEPHFGRLMAASRVEKKLVVDCTYLKRVEFSTATGMLAMVTKVRQNGATVEFRNVNYLIGALFSLLGVDAVAQIQLRRV
jgi:anti-anti-sigma regulatory factor